VAVSFINLKLGKVAFVLKKTYTIGLFVIDVKVLNFNRGTDIKVPEEEYSQTS
jgi:hypothetical protein